MADLMTILVRRVICRLNARSINACVAMQMCQRVRTLRDKKITFVCDNRVKDWNRYPGYDITSVAEAAPEGCDFHRRVFQKAFDRLILSFVLL